MSTPRPRKAKEPSYRHHKPSGQAFVQIKGKRHYLGKHGTPETAPESHQLYQQYLAEWRRSALPPPPAPADELKILTLADRYWAHAKLHYVKHGEPTGTANNQFAVLKRLLALYSETRVIDFGPLALQALRQTWITDGNSIKTVNDKTSVVRGIFKWGVSQQLVPLVVFQALETVGDLQRGRGQARETSPIGPVPDEVIEATLPHLPAIVADMVKLQRLTGCRPQEVRLLRFADIQRFDVPERPLPLFVAAERELAPPRELDEWLWRPARHKTEHHGRGRIIPIGPHGQGLLQPHLLRLAFKPDEFVFTTATGKPYTKDGYVRSIRRACEAAFHLPKGLRDRALSQAAKRLKTGSLAVLAGELTPEQLQAQAEQLQLQRQQATRWRDEHVWHPNQIRHTYATAARKVSDLEHVRTVLGHARSSTTEIYAERDLEKARAIARLIG